MRSELNKNMFLHTVQMHLKRNLLKTFYTFLILQFALSAGVKTLWRLAATTANAWFMSNSQEFKRGKWETSISLYAAPFVVCVLYESFYFIYLNVYVYCTYIWRSWRRTCHNLYRMPKATDNFPIHFAPDKSVLCVNHKFIHNYKT